MAFWQNKPNLTTPISATNLNNLAGGWTKISETLTFGSADSPTFVINTSADTTGYLSVGMKIKLTQTTVKYFIITAITSTTITVYGGTDYVLANAVITNAFFSVHKSPFGFPMNPDKWSVLLKSVTSFTQTSPTAGVWYNIASISVPIGSWDVNWGAALFAVSTSSQTQLRFAGTLSTTNNGETNNEFSIYQGFNVPSGSLVFFASSYREARLTLTSKASLYLNVSTILANATSVGAASDRQPVIIKATCAYL